MMQEYNLFFNSIFISNVLFIYDHVLLINVKRYDGVVIIKDKYYKKTNAVSQNFIHH